MGRGVDSKLDKSVVAEVLVGSLLEGGFGGGLPNSGVRPSRASFTDLVSEASVNSMAVTLLAS